MTQEDKELLLKDLSARLPYGVKVKRFSKILKLISIRPSYRYCVECELEEGVNMSYDIDDIKPYLRPMSSMTEEECLELSKLKPIYDEVEAWKYIKTPVPLAIANIEQFDFFHSHHLDWRDLIPKGLALEAPEGMYNLKD